MICDNVRCILDQNKLYAKKMYGQNFLMDKNILKRIIELSNVTKEDIIIEIGPGIGCLTEFLATASQKVIAYEIDEDMIRILNKTLSPYSNVEIRHIDFLKADLSEYLNVSNVKVVANLPYYITTPIITKLLSETNIENFLFMVQKEVGERITGKPKTKDYNALSVLMNYKTNSKIVAHVNANSFFPVPKVDSVLLLIEKKKIDCKPNNEANFLKFVQNAFVQRRKTIVNNLISTYSIKRDEAEAVLKKNGLKTNCRSEELDEYQLLNIYKELFEK